MKKHTKKAEIIGYPQKPKNNAFTRLMKAIEEPKIKTFLVSWVIHVSATNAQEAASEARKIQLRPDSYATFFEVKGKGKKAILIDIGEQKMANIQRILLRLGILIERLHLMIADSTCDLITESYCNPINVKKNLSISQCVQRMELATAREFLNKLLDLMK